MSYYSFIKTKLVVLFCFVAIIAVNTVSPMYASLPDLVVQIDRGTNQTVSRESFLYMRGTLSNLLRMFSEQIKVP